MGTHALELTLDEDGDASLRADWSALDAAGIPSLTGHLSPSNAPHVTVVATPTPIGGVLRDLARDALGPCLPSVARLGGYALFGGRRLALARLVEPSAELVAAVRRVREAVPTDVRPTWVPHVSVARGLTHEQAAAALVVLRDRPMTSVTLARLRHWDVTDKVVTPLT
ncbi:2'-5' RNA ligase family protein [Janibacter massiliensis]|uniref:2'-5' RNA ligase family protein n=1 Tax=Janibacter massiliensis TaxID=2058291 RepID=UPI00131A5F6C|nr:2'-5' RNA ligase family protein [Janibacter massiliensis]